MKINLNKENEDRLIPVSLKLDKSCSWIINQILKSIELEDLEIRQEISLNVKVEEENVIPVKKRKMSV